MLNSGFDLVHGIHFQASVCCVFLNLSSELYPLLLRYFIPHNRYLLSQLSLISCNIIFCHYNPSYLTAHILYHGSTSYHTTYTATSIFFPSKLHCLTVLSILSHSLCHNHSPKPVTTIPQTTKPLSCHYHTTYSQYPNLSLLPSYNYHYHYY